VEDNDEASYVGLDGRAGRGQSPDPFAGDEDQETEDELTRSLSQSLKLLSAAPAPKEETAASEEVGNEPPPSPSSLDPEANP